MREITVVATRSEHWYDRYSISFLLPGMEHKPLLLMGFPSIFLDEYGLAAVFKGMNLPIPPISTFSRKHEMKGKNGVYEETIQIPDMPVCYRKEKLALYEFEPTSSFESCAYILYSINGRPVYAAADETIPAVCDDYRNKNSIHAEWISTSLEEVIKLDDSEKGKRDVTYMDGRVVSHSGFVEHTCFV